MAKAQLARDPFAAWVFPGIGWQASPSWRLTGHYGYHPWLRLHAGYVQAFYRAGKYWTLNPAYLALAGASRPEHTFLHGVIFSIQPGKRWLLEDRQQLWNRMRGGEGDLHFYRNRLRLFALPGEGQRLRPYVVGEAFYLFNRGRWSRYRTGAGLLWEVPRHISVDVSVVREKDGFSGRRFLAFVMVTVPVAQRQVERKGQQK